MYTMKFIKFLILLTILATPSFAADSAKDWDKDVKRAEKYLNELKTARSRFVQTTHDGTQLVGTFYLNRPGKLRFEYDAPIEDFVVADGLFIYFYDAELKEQTNAPIGQTLADFILRKNLELSGDLTVKNVRRSGDYLQIETVQTADPEAGKLILGFSENPMQLKKWRIIDTQGLITEVELFYLKTGIKHESGLFAYHDPVSKTKLPGLGNRSARRIALHLLTKRTTAMNHLTRTLQTASEQVKECEVCYNLDTVQPCRICQSIKRDRSKICVVANVSDLWAIERTASYKGLYHVLGGVLSALDGIGPKDLNIHSLLTRAEDEEITEIILALSATVDGQSTAHYIADHLDAAAINITRLAHGVPVGGELDYLDDGTITTALKSRSRA